MRRLLALLSLALPLASLACGGPGKLAPEPLVVSVSLSLSTFIPGDTVDVTVSVTNATSANVIVAGSSTCLLAFHVLDQASDVVARSDATCTADLVNVTIPAGGKVSQTFQWSGDSAGSDSPAPLQPGSYSVVGLLEADSGERTSAPVNVKLLTM